MRFWDSSAVVPLLIEQAASSRTDQWWAADPQIALWALTPVEITSALWRLVRDRVFADDAARTAEARGKDLVDASYMVIDIEAVKALAQRLLRVHPLRAADALQLAAAIVWAGGQPSGKTMHTLDECLAIAARREGFEVP